MKRLATVIIIICLLNTALYYNGVCLGCAPMVCEFFIDGCGEVSNSCVMVPSECGSCTPVRRLGEPACCTPEDKPEPRVCKIDIIPNDKIECACTGHVVMVNLVTTHEERRTITPVNVALALPDNDPSENFDRCHSYRQDSRRAGVHSTIPTTILRL